MRPTWTAGIALVAGALAGVAGPFLDGGNLRGIYIFRVATMAEAQALAATDPAVKAGRLRLEFHPWFAAKNITVTAHKECAQPAR